MLLPRLGEYWVAAAAKFLVTIAEVTTVPPRR